MSENTEVYRTHDMIDHPAHYTAGGTDAILREGKGMTCPECGGVGGIQWMDEWGAFTDYIPCETCNETGEIPDESTVYGNDCPTGKCEW